MASEETDFGVRGWNAFNNLKNSSTRTEIGASLLAMIRRKPANIGIDSKATIVKGEKLIDHARKRSTTRTKEEDGTLLLGGEVSQYHRDSPWKKCWQLTKDGDLWRKFNEAIIAKNPQAVKLSKVKGHATTEMVEEGKVPFEEKYGNDQADMAAEKGTELGQGLVKRYATFYEKRHNQYVKFVGRVQSFIVKVKGEDTRLRREKNLEKNPTKDKDKEKTTIPMEIPTEHNTTETIKIILRKPRREDYEDGEQWEEATKAANFIGQTRWCAEGGEAAGGIPGITWLELFFLYKMHDTKKTAETFLVKKENLKKTNG